ncbi:Ca2+-binding RTX toxin-like protein [Actinopolyspora lacussalsi]|nr:Ca2+-binding RTX toxin-like protein [Actinopolyspora lacussalsi]
MRTTRTRTGLTGLVGTGIAAAALVVGAPLAAATPSQTQPTLTAAADEENHQEGTEGPDGLHGTPGQDVIKVRGGFDVIFGEADDDSLFGNSGNDVIRGGNGDDFFHGGQGGDYLYAGPGDDTVMSDELGSDDEADVVDCGPGTDRYNADLDDKVVNCEILYYGRG